MTARITSWALAIILMVTPFGAMGSSMKVVPTKVTLDDRSETAVLTLTNEGKDKITVQLDAKSWDQDDQGTDNYSETRDIVFFPKILEVEPATERIIRIGYQGEATPAKERTYRIFLQELPVTKPGEMALRFAITLSIPIFIQPSMEHGDVAIEEVSQQHGQLRVKVRNGGNTHVVVNGITLKGLDAAGQGVFSNEMRGWYLLSNKSKNYELQIPEDGCSQAAKIEVEVQAGGDTVATLIDADAGQCGAYDNATSQVAN